MWESGETHAMTPAERRKSRRERSLFGMMLLRRRVALDVHQNYIGVLWNALELE